MPACLYSRLLYFINQLFICSKLSNLFSFSFLWDTLFKDVENFVDCLSGVSMNLMPVTILGGLTIITSHVERCLACWLLLSGELYSSICQLTLFFIKILLQFLETYVRSTPCCLFWCGFLVVFFFLIFFDPFI